MTQKLNEIYGQQKYDYKQKHIYWSIVKPITTYGAEVRKLTRNEQTKLQATEMDFLRRSRRTSRLQHIPNDVVKQMADNAITYKIEQRQLILYGHVMRKNDNRWPGKIIEYWHP